MLMYKVLKIRLDFVYLDDFAHFTIDLLVNVVYYFFVKVEFYLVLEIIQGSIAYKTC